MPRYLKELTSFSGLPSKLMGTRGRGEFFPPRYYHKFAFSSIQCEVIKLRHFRYIFLDYKKVVSRVYGMVEEHIVCIDMNARLFRQPDVRLSSGTLLLSMAQMELELHFPYSSLCA